MALAAIGYGSLGHIAAIADAQGDLLQFTSAAKLELIEIKYDDWSYILHATVFDAGRSDRAYASPPKPGVGRRIVKSNTSSTRFEGNRLHFLAFEGENLKTLHRIRREFEALPGAVPMAEWTRSQQLAYWLNLYNVMLIEALAREYPVRKLRKQLYGRHGLLDRKLLTVAGVKLSLNDIHHRILIPNWHDPLIIYGLFHGYVGCANIRREAYTAENVYRLLKENATEFINSNRGARMDGDTLMLSELYAINAALFEDDAALKAHIAAYADPGYAERFAAAAAISTGTSDYYIADFFQGVTNDFNPNSANPAAIAFASNSPDFNEFLAAKMGPGAMSTIPQHVLNYIGKIRERRAAREGQVSVEEYVAPPSDQPQKPTEPKQPQ